MNINGFCLNQNCKYYIEWEWQFDPECQPHPCVSCKLQGQSTEITDIAKDCRNKINYDMLEALIREHRVANHPPQTYGICERLKPIIEQATGKTIDEVLKESEHDKNI